MDDVQWRFSHGSKVEAKYCPIEIDGDVKYYICPRNEICCTFGCCISSNFHFYQLWYYWLMVILMFLLCSGGTWWYRYWLQESHYSHPPSSSHRPQSLTRHRPPPTRVAYHPGHNTVVVQQIWKPQRNGQLANPMPPPLYSVVQQSSAAAGQPVASGTNQGNAVNLNRSPYYQLYGPPPSYDSVMTERVQCELQVDGQSEQQVSTDNEQSSTSSQALPRHHQCDSESALPK